jgi:hypothetical protein
VYLKLIACEVACREIGLTAAYSPHMIDMEFLPVGHHDDPKTGHKDLQTRVHSAPAGKYDAILAGYGICNQMLNGLTANHTPIIIPRAHDCITFFLGSKERYQEVFNACPGTYYFTAGWLEFPKRKARAQGGKAASEYVGAQVSPFSMGKSYAELVAKYGEDNARYLIEVTEKWTQSYQRGTLIHFDFNQALGLREKVAEICRQHGWTMDELKGDLGLLQRWVNGQWDAGDFLTVQPGQAVFPTYDQRVIEAKSVA